MTNYGQTSKELEEEYEKEEDVVETKYISTFPKKFSSMAPCEQLRVKVPNTNSKLNVILGVKLPHSDMHDTTPCVVNMPNSLKKKRY